VQGAFGNGDERHPTLPAVARRAMICGSEGGKFVERVYRSGYGAEEINEGKLWTSGAEVRDRRVMARNIGGKEPRARANGQRGTPDRRPVDSRSRVLLYTDTMFP